MYSSFCCHQVAGVAFLTCSQLPMSFWTGGNGENHSRQWLHVVCAWIAPQASSAASAGRAKLTRAVLWCFGGNHMHSVKEKIVRCQYASLQNIPSELNLYKYYVSTMSIITNTIWNVMENSASRSKALLSDCRQIQALIIAHVTCIVTKPQSNVSRPLFWISSSSFKVIVTSMIKMKVLRIVDKLREYE